MARRGGARPGKARHGSWVVAVGYTNSIQEGRFMATKKETNETMAGIQVTRPAFYTATIKGMAGLLMNKMPDLSQPKASSKSQEKEDPAEKEKRLWREKLYFDGQNQVYIPGENIHECLIEGTAYWGEKVSGNKTYTDLVKSAVVVDSLYFDFDKESSLIVPFGKAANGNPSRGKKSGCKVYKIRPLIMPWGGLVNFHVFDPRLTLNVMKTIFTFAGTYKGVCDWRPQFGRFELIDLKENQI